MIKLKQFFIVLGILLPCVLLGQTKRVLPFKNCGFESDKKVAEAVERALPRIAEAVEVIARTLKQSGWLFYIGAGTSGRIGVADESRNSPENGFEYAQYGNNDQTW